MLNRAHRFVARCAVLLLLAAEVFAQAPQLHGHDLGSAAALRGASAASSVSAERGARAADGDCLACRLASLATVLPGALPLAVALPRAGGAPPLPQHACPGPAAASSRGRAPPLA
jgi:hypothetical protein